MARIRILDEWLRSPAALVTQRRQVMVVADGWAEQRVLMRAFANAEDQTRPTIRLHGIDLAISPAGTDAYGPWGVHVDSPEDGAAQALRDQLALAAKRLAGSKGNPARLLDEPSRFESRPTGHWRPGVPRDRRTPAPHQAPSMPAAHTTIQDRVPPSFTDPGAWSHSPLPRESRVFRKTTLPAPARARRQTGDLAQIVGRTLPVGFQLSELEQSVLSMLGMGESLSESQLATHLRGAEPSPWMADLQVRLKEHGLDIFEVFPGPDGLPRYRLKR